MPEKFESQPEEQEENQLTFRDLRMEDLDDMVRIRNIAVKKLAEDDIPFGSGKETTKEEYSKILQEILNGMEKGSSVSVAAEMDGELVGWIAGGRKPDANVPTAIAGVVMMEKKARSLKNMNDMAREWLARARHQWPDIKKIETKTSIKNRAQNLWKWYGFKEVGKEIMPNGKIYIALEKNLEEGIDTKTNIE